METDAKMVVVAEDKKVRQPIDIVFSDIHYSVNVEIDKDECKIPCNKKFEEK